MSAGITDGIFTKTAATNISFTLNLSGDTTFRENPLKNLAVVVNHLLASTTSAKVCGKLFGVSGDRF